MRELRFHRDLYRGECVDAAVQLYARYAALTTREEDTHWVVSVEASAPEREERIGNELANYALGLTVRDGGPR